MRLLIILAAILLFAPCTGNKVLVIKRGNTCNQHKGYVGYEQSQPHHAPKIVKRKSY